MRVLNSDKIFNLYVRARVCNRNDLYTSNNHASDLVTLGIIIIARGFEMAAI